MKLASIFSALEEAGGIEQLLIHTGQHYDPELKEVFFSELRLPHPVVQLEVGSGSHGEQTGKALIGLERAFLDSQPQLVVVFGDVNSTLAGALAAVKLGIDVCHVEAGLRSFDWTMPEEHNRRLTDHISTLLLTHSSEADANLAAEGIGEDRIELVGNTMVDTLLVNIERARMLKEWRRLGVDPGEFVLVTLHRPALVDDPRLLRETMEALGVLSKWKPVVFAAHPRTAARLGEGVLVPSGVRLLPPLPYGSFLSLELAAAAVVTDSGGVQEETTALGVRCFTLRENTERHVTITSGTNTLLGLNPSRLREIPGLVDAAPPPALPPLWDGRAGWRAARAIRRLLLAGQESEI
jgi:UDP-N-acetylglucosamine 2-epimerase (non-hydrolysing)